MEVINKNLNKKLTLLDKVKNYIILFTFFYIFVILITSIFVSSYDNAYSIDNYQKEILGVLFFLFSLPLIIDKFIVIKNKFNKNKYISNNLINNF